MGEDSKDETGTELEDCLPVASDGLKYLLSAGGVMRWGTKLIQEAYILLSCNHTEQGVKHCTAFPGDERSRLSNMLEITVLRYLIPPTCPDGLFLCFVLTLRLLHAGSQKMTRCQHHPDGSRVTCRNLWHHDSP